MSRSAKLDSAWDNILELGRPNHTHVHIHVHLQRHIPVFSVCPCSFSFDHILALPVLTTAYKHALLCAWISTSACSLRYDFPSGPVRCYTARDKQRKLQETLQEHDFKHVVADVELFCTDTAGYLTATDVGSDVATAKDLLERCRQRDADLDAKRSAVDDVVRLADALCSAGHFRAEEISACKAATVATYERLVEPMCVGSLESLAWAWACV